MTDMAHLFDAIREIKGEALTQIEVDKINAALAGSPEIPGGGWLPASLALIKEFEGCRLTAYPDPGSGGDPWTVGWGSTGPGIKRGTTWTQMQADDRLAYDVNKFAEGVAAAIGAAPTTDNQRAAMISLAYNIGLGNFRTSTLLRMHKEGDYAGAAGQFARWNKAAGKVLSGLTRRRAAEAARYLA